MKDGFSGYLPARGMYWPVEIDLSPRVSPSNFDLSCSMRSKPCWTEVLFGIVYLRTVGRESPNSLEISDMVKLLAD